MNPDRVVDADEMIGYFRALGEADPVIWMVAGLMAIAAILILVGHAITLHSQGKAWLRWPWRKDDS